VKNVALKKAVSFPVDNYKELRIQMLNWVNRFSIFCVLDNQEYHPGDASFECLVAAGSASHIEAAAGDAFDKLQDFCAAHTNEWIFGHLGYDLKNDDGQRSSTHHDGIGFSDLYFFVPELVIELGRTEIKIHTDADATHVLPAIMAAPVSMGSKDISPVAIQHRIKKEDYTGIIERLRQHILRGDCYEINFCQEFYAEEIKIDPLLAYHRLTELSPNPFAAFYRIHDKYCCCASPERYLKKTGKKIMSQPIKGTSKRHLNDPAIDDANRQYLLQSSKEKSENVMVVDLVRNDLSRICVPGSVKVEELFGIYSFPQVHQMISTISGELRDGVEPADIFRHTFPMGSMTGAPKIRVMQLIEQYEQTKRGLFSGAIGYISPAGDMDMNVVIRSLFYNASTRYLSFQTGSGITFYSEPEKEYEECMMKADAMMRIFGG
jgi:para-aminobenzoate synthetase component 1